MKGRDIIAQQAVPNGSPGCSKPVGPTSSLGTGSMWDGLEAGAHVCGGGLRLKKGETAQDRVNISFMISRKGGALGYKPRTGYWLKYRPMAEKVVDGTLMDTPLGQRASSAVPGLQRPHVATFCSRELADFASATNPRHCH